jgi:hypothetical protein
LALSNSENAEKGKGKNNNNDDCWRRIKTENYFFVPFGLKLIFTVLWGLPILPPSFEAQKRCGQKKKRAGEE